MNPLLYIGIGTLIGLALALGDGKRVQGTKRGPIIGVALLVATFAVRILLVTELPGLPVVQGTIDFLIPTTVGVLLLKEGI